MKITYPAMRFRQSTSAKWLVLFGASAIEIDQWTGVPQKLRLGEEESAGFQRTVSVTRLQAITSFFGDPRNVMQNALLCAVQDGTKGVIEFDVQTDNGISQTGVLTIAIPDLATRSLAELLRDVKDHLERRVPSLKDRPFPDHIYQKLERRYRGANGDDDQEDLEEDDETLNGTGETEFDDALFEESHVADFWTQLVARQHLAEKLALDGEDEIMGFSRQVLEAYLRPVVLVDGQHRLAGALNAARRAVEDDAALTAKLKQQINDGASVEDVYPAALAQKVRTLPVSLLMDASPAEHVFQFIVVNQKATPVPKALLQTIINTSLDPSELDPIKTRLQYADIKLESSRAIYSLARDPRSPFNGHVARGFAEDSSEMLPWSVFVSLAEIFYQLQGAKFYHDPSMDHAKNWRDKRLEGSKIVEDWATLDHGSGFEYWQSPDGPWRDVFIAFWARVKEKLASDNPSATNFWGDNKNSQIFNKPSLHILTVDFFEFLEGMRAPIESIPQVSDLVDQWLEDAPLDYFAKPWKLSGVKKDSVGIRRQWSFLWSRSRRQGKLPGDAEFSKVRRAN